MPVSVQFFCALLVLLVASRLLGELAVRVGQPQLVGELVAGVALGAVINAYPGALPHLVRVSDTETFRIIVEMGAFFLMLLAGLELHPGELAKKSLNSAFVATGGVIVPLLAGGLVGWFFLPPSDERTAQLLFLGVVLAITDVPIALWILMDVKKLHTPVGRTVVSAAIYDDVLGLLMLAFLTAVLTTGTAFGWLDTLYILGRIAAFFAISVAVGLYILPRVRSMLHTLRETEHEFSELIVAGLIYGIVAETLGLHLILGAFLAGLFFIGKSKDADICDNVKCKVSGITSGFLAPIFFASVGLNVDMRVLTNAPLFIAVLLIVAVASKVVGCAVPARLTGLRLKDSFTVGIAMTARGAVGLVVAEIGLEKGLLDGTDSNSPIVAHLYSSVVTVAIVTAIVAPIALRLAVGRISEPSSESTIRPNV